MVPSKTVTIFGGSGFLGRRIVRRLAVDGYRVRVAVRHPERATRLQSWVNDSRVELARADVWEDATVAPAVAGADAVINTVGHYVEAGRASFEAIHGRGAQNVARQAQRAAAKRLIHISGLGADTGSDSPYVRARAVGEALVSEAFEGATILRPSVVFGPEDSFFNTLAGLARRAPVLPLFGRGRTRLQPVYVGDVAEACVKALADATSKGRTYELGGPKVYSYRALVELAMIHVGRRRLLMPVPFPLWDALAALLAILPNPPLTRDQVKLMKRDNVVHGQASTLQDLGIAPTAVEEVLPGYVSPDAANPAP